MIRRRSSRDRDEGGQEKDEGDVSDAALFKLDELHEKRILSWSPESEEEPEAEGEEPSDPVAERPPTRVFAPEPPGKPLSPAAAALARQQAAPRPAPPEPAPPEETPTEAAPAQAVAPAQPPPQRTTPAQATPGRPTPTQTTPQAAPRSSPVPARTALATPAKAAPAREPERTPAERPAAEAATQSGASADSEPRRRGRPRGRPRRQVHFHVDPDEERMLMYAVELYGSQQKGLIAALQALQDAEFLRSEIERLKAETERQRELLDEAESLFNR